jgi:hypothetical protein
MRRPRSRQDKLGKYRFSDFFIVGTPLVALIYLLAIRFVALRSSIRSAIGATTINPELLRRAKHVPWPRCRTPSLAA